MSKCVVRCMNRTRQTVHLLFLLGALGILRSSAYGQSNPAQKTNSGNPQDTLAAGFANPPASARPRVWWHWMNGNITKEGIRLDLEWMKRVGIAGMQNFDANLDTPQVVDRRLVFMTPE